MTGEDADTREFKRRMYLRASGADVPEESRPVVRWAVVAIAALAAAAIGTSIALAVLGSMSRLGRW